MGIELEKQFKDEDDIVSVVVKKSLEWYLEGYEGVEDRYDWGDEDEPKGRELL